MPGCPVGHWGPLSCLCAREVPHSPQAGLWDPVGQQAATREQTSRQLKSPQQPSQQAGWRWQQQLLQQHQRQWQRQQPQLHPLPHSVSVSPPRARLEPSLPAHPLTPTRLAAKLLSSQGMQAPRATSRARRHRWPPTPQCPICWSPVTLIPLWIICPSPPQRSPVNGQSIVTSYAAQDTAGFCHIWHTSGMPGHLWATRPQGTPAQESHIKH